MSERQTQSAGAAAGWVEAAVGRAPGAAFAMVAALIAVPKLLRVLVGGVSFEYDTLTYLVFRVPYHHPPLYSLLLDWISVVSRHGLAIAVVQVVLFSVGATLFTLHFVRDRRGRLVVAAVLGLEPTSGFFCASLMSESVFQALLLVWLAALALYAAHARRRGAAWLVAVIGVLAALMYATRLAAIILPPFVVLVSIVATRRPLLTVRHAIVLLIVFQATLVPFKLLFWQEYGRFALSMFTGSNLWNITSVLYPDSSLRDAPRTPFERFLAERGTEEFSTANALGSNTLDDPTSAYEEFVNSHPFESTEKMNEFEHSLTRTARTMVLENPLGYLVRFVGPSFAVVLWRDETIDVDPQVAGAIERKVGVRQLRPVEYRSATWAVYFVLLVATTIVALIRRRPGPALAVLLGACWYYLFVLPTIAALFLRYVLILAPPILVAAWLALRAER